MELWNRRLPPSDGSFIIMDTSDGFEAARLAARLYSMLKEELQEGTEGEGAAFYALARIGLRETTWDR